MVSSVAMTIAGKCHAKQLALVFLCQFEGPFKRYEVRKHIRPTQRMPLQVIDVMGAAF